MIKQNTMLHIQGITKQFGYKLLFKDASAHLGHRSRVALIGPNGAGKSTLIKIILGHESPDEGQISKASHLSIGYLSQEIPKFAEGTILDEVMRLDGRRGELLEVKTELETAFEKDIPSEADLERYGRIQEELEHLDEYRLESRAKTILSGMGFSEADFNRSLSEFSGGWLMRVALSRILLMDPDLLLLDEPTNHLDLESLLWLEKFLSEYQGAMMLISHDTTFLNRIVTEVLEIDQKRLWSYKGNLHAYALQKEERLTILRAQYAGQQAKIAEIESFVARFGAKATKARQAQSRLKQLEKMERIELPDENETVRFRFPPAPHSGKEVITMKNTSLSFGDRAVFKDLEWIIQKGTRTAIVGVNGAGKTTLLKLLAQKLNPTQGQVKVGHQVHIGYYAQMQAESLDPGKTIFEELQSVSFDIPTARVRSIAGSFLFTGDAIEKKCSVLSGGEKARVALAKLLLSPSNFLILDEPTNHLDVESREVLLEALQSYDGTLCLVSHDRSFISPLVDSVLEIVPSETGSRAIPLVGGYEDYLERKLREMNEMPESKYASGKTHTPKKSAAPKTQSVNSQKRTLERKREQAEKEITRLEKEQSQIHEELSSDQIYQDQKKMLLLIEKQKEIGNNLGSKLSEWEELCQRIEMLQD